MSHPARSLITSGQKQRPPVTTTTIIVPGAPSTEGNQKTTRYSMTGPTVFSDTDYEDALEHIIQRDYYPSALSLDQRRHVEQIPYHDPMAPSLTSFHAAVTSREAAVLDEQQRRESEVRSQQHARMYQQHPPLSAIEGQRPVAALRNSFYFPVTAATASIGGASNLEMYDSSHTTNDASSAKSATEESLRLSSILAAKEETLVVEAKTKIEPAATRFPAPQRRKKNELHWEGSSCSEISDNDDDASTDLDETVVASIRSEIRKATKRSRRPMNHHGERAATVAINAASIPSNETSASLTTYHLPPESSRDLAAGAALQKRRRQVALLQPQPIPAPVRLTTTSQAPPSARSSGALAFALRASYSRKAVSRKKRKSVTKSTTTNTNAEAKS